jgi:hypothetical protein
VVRARLPLSARLPKRYGLVPRFRPGQSRIITWQQANDNVRKAMCDAKAGVVGHKV